MNSQNIQIDLPDSLKNEMINCNSLPSLPAIALQVLEASKNPEIGLSDVSDIIRSDPALSAKLLKIANSPVYSIRRTINNLREALTLLGLNASLTITLSFSLVKSLKNNKNLPFIHDNYWKRSILAATIARHIGFKHGMTNLEDLFLSALLQDIGILILACMKPGIYNEDQENYTSHNDKIKLEKQRLGYDHADIAAWFLKNWQFPNKLCQAVKQSHQLETEQLLPDNNQLFHRCISFSGQLADLWIQGNNQEYFDQNLETAQKALGLDQAGYEEFIADINQLIPDVFNLFDTPVPANVNIDEVLNNAKELLLERNLNYIKQNEEDRRQIENIIEQNRYLEKEANLDPLTQVYNRKYFEQVFEEEYTNSNENRWPLSLAFIDIDNFKAINDNFGHTIGDKVLKEISQFIQSHIRQTDILARYGGDEFILLLPGAINTDAQKMLERLLNNLRADDTSHIKGSDIRITLSIGLASHHDRHNFINKDSLVNAADSALYQVKKKGRDNIHSY